MLWLTERMKSKKLTLGISPCPNDTFIFDALIHHKIDTGGLSFEVIFSDVEELNKKAFQSLLDITKLSYYAYFHLIENYVILNSGSALGHCCGPLLISKKKYAISQVKDLSIAIPGQFTTAHFLLNSVFPNLTKKKMMIFSEIEDAIINDTVEAGIIIHENRFTYLSKGLIKIIDLGECWEQKTKLPIPLGCIAVKRNLPVILQQKINKLIMESTLFALSNPRLGFNFIKSHAQEMDAEVLYEHIQLYVNDYTVDLGKRGKKAIITMFQKVLEEKVIDNININSIFVKE